MSDNLGLRGVLEAFEEVEASPRFQQEINFERIRRIVVVVVNSRSAPATDWDTQPAAAGHRGAAAAVVQRADRPLLLRVGRAAEGHRAALGRQAQARRGRAPAGRHVAAPRPRRRCPTCMFDAIDVSFDSIDDLEERRYFMNLPTSFVLPPEAVDRLRDLGGRLLRESTDLPGVAAPDRGEQPRARKPRGLSSARRPGAGRTRSTTDSVTLAATWSPTFTSLSTLGSRTFTSTRLPSGPLSVTICFLRSTCLDVGHQGGGLRSPRRRACRPLRCAPRIRTRPSRGCRRRP